jgi:hypothetical protein
MARDQSLLMEGLVVLEAFVHADREAPHTRLGSNSAALATSASLGARRIRTRS